MADSKIHPEAIGDARSMSTGLDSRPTPQTSFVGRIPDPLLRLVPPVKAIIVALCVASTAYWVAELVGPLRGVIVAERGVGRIHDDAEHVIYLGGIVLERNRHSIVGGATGCVAGAALGAGAAATVGLFTAGAGFAAIPTASLVGCGIAGLGGIAVGYPLDDYNGF